MKILNRILILFVVFAVCSLFLPGIIDAIKAIHNPINKLMVLCVTFVGGVIAFFGCVDFVFRTKIAEKIVATLVSNILWEIVKFVGNIVCRAYNLTVYGFSYIVKLIGK